MTSTNLAQLQRRLPPLPGLLDDSLEQGIRARQRRNFIIDNPSQKLSALRVCDDAIDQILLSASLYGQDAALQLDRRIAAATGAARDAVIFLRIAIAVQTQDSQLLELTQEYLPQSYRAVRDAYWFYPVPIGALDDSSQHILALFEKCLEIPSLRPFALELAGRRDVKKLRPQIRDLQDDPLLVAAAQLALVRMGGANQASKHFIESNLLSEDDAQVSLAIDMAAIDPRLIDDTLLNQALDLPMDQVDAAWAIAAARHPGRLFNYALQRDELPAALWCRIVAVTGYLEGIIMVCAEIADEPGTISALHADVLELTLGEVPAEARCEPNDQQQKSKALRTLLLRLCRGAHIGLSNDADRCPWDINAMLDDPTQCDGVRLRFGKTLRDEVVAGFGIGIVELTHPLRQWLYIERASTAAHPFALSSHDVARRQEMALMVAQFAETLHVD